MVSIADRMKRYETDTEHSLPDGLPVIIRVDGHGFSKFTGGFQKPFDERLHAAMQLTTENLLQYHSDATTAYTQSDEISEKKRA